MDNEEISETIPDVVECERLCKEFAAITDTNTALAQSMLQHSNWNLETSLNAYWNEDLTKSTSEGGRGPSGLTKDLAALDEEDNIPDVNECQRLCDEFAQVTNTNTALAQSVLQLHGWKLAESVSAFLESAAVEKGSGSSSKKTIAAVLDDDVIFCETVASPTKRFRRENSRHDGPVIEVLPDSDSHEPNSVSSRDTGQFWRVAGQSALSLSLQSQATRKSTESLKSNIKLISWNIDGLDNSNIGGRADGVVAEITNEKPDVVFLQEVVMENLAILGQNLSASYHFVLGGDTEYFTAILLKKDAVQLESDNIVLFPGTRMGRNLVIVQAKYNGVFFTFMTAHLESTAEHSDERQNQLKICFEQMQKQSPERIVVFGGDLNLRDPEVKKIGLPKITVDIWAECGQRDECKVTWDTVRNHNAAEKCAGFKFKPKCRFDRLYFRPSVPASLVPVHFGLVGLKKAPKSQKFCSDHWGIMCVLDSKK